MAPKRKAFTLIELLVAIGIAMVLLAVLFPVFASAKRKAYQTAWVESVRQVSFATSLYMTDYDDYYMIPRYVGDESEDATNDRTWVQALLPYTREFNQFLCPVDYSRDPSISIFDGDITPGDSYARYYKASKRSNIGFNYLYLSPMVNDRGWRSIPRTSSQVSDPSNTIVFGESAWEIIDGKPSGGGNYLIIPPCRFSSDWRNRDTFNLQQFTGSQIYVPGLIWTNTELEEEEFQAGGIYPWFSPKVTIVVAAGTAKRVSLSQLTDGCDVQPNWQGYVTSFSRYMWDIR